ncbi:hypothetical protein [Listeria monocytogenes]|uniref:hypothetical protein n=1 Tax=Listeria monocytogenes TaxID=1639 RepID=UPI0011F39027|nr:hypothetical protein [Listeria monocytogenes]TYV90624.1 hypothetical protein FZ079_13875 [Listeria monocytogenes]
MESYIQITNEAAAKMIVNGDYKELWYAPNRASVLCCNYHEIDLSNLETFKFFVRLSDEK